MLADKEQAFRRCGSSHMTDEQAPFHSLRIRLEGRLERFIRHNFTAHFSYLLQFNLGISVPQLQGTRALKHNR